MHFFKSIVKAYICFIQQNQEHSGPPLSQDLVVEIRTGGVPPDAPAKRGCFALLSRLSVVRCRLLSRRRRSGGRKTSIGAFFYFIWFLFLGFLGGVRIV
ncbi:hypothetical protein ACOSQ2_032503 [Xanthoceras sorbifolium]